jgi:sialic acid synthase SpsE
MNYVESKGMIFISTPFSRAASNRLNKMWVEAYKIWSWECNNYPLIEHIASFWKPIILSTWMNNIESIKKGNYKVYGNICIIIFRCDWLDCCYYEYFEVARKIGLPVIWGELRDGELRGSWGTYIKK